MVSLTDTVGRSEEGEDGRAARYDLMRRLVAESFAPFAARVADAAGHADIRLLGTSGTVTTLASLYLELPSYDRRAVDGLIVPAGEMRDISARLSVMTPYERSNLPCIGQESRRSGGGRLRHPRSDPRPLARTAAGGGRSRHP